jgi:hypothetical protein
MVSEDKGTSSKKLYSFIKSKKCDGSGVAPLKKDGKIYADASEKAELLNEQFSSVFSEENTSTIPNLGTSKTPAFVLGDHVPDIIIIRFSTALFVLLLDVFVTSASGCFCNICFWMFL